MLMSREETAGRATTSFSEAVEAVLEEELVPPYLEAVGEVVPSVKVAMAPMCTERPAATAPLAVVARAERTIATTEDLYAVRLATEATATRLFIGSALDRNRTCITSFGGRYSIR